MRKLYTGKNEPPAFNYYLRAIIWYNNRFTVRTSVVNRGRPMKKAMEVVSNQMYNSYWKRGIPTTYLLAISETVPFYCSEAKDGKLDTPECRQLIGYGIQGNNYMAISHKYNADAAYLEKSSKFFFQN